MDKATRVLTVSYLAGGDGTAPMIRIKGRWLRDAGFEIGDRIAVQISEGKLIVTKIPEGGGTTHGGSKTTKQPRQGWFGFLDGG